MSSRINQLLCICLVLLPIQLSCQIELLNDEFCDTSSIINWHNINETEGWGIVQLESALIDPDSGGYFKMVPFTSSWFEDYRGALIYKNLAGDFIATIKVSVEGRSATLPEDDFNLAGIMIRTPQDYPNGALGTGGWQAGDQNYIFLSIGAANNGDPRCDPSPSPCTLPHLEVKTTSNSISTLDIEDIDTSAVQLRLARIGEAVIVLYKLEGDPSWIVHRRYQRSDFPNTLQVGLVTYTDWTKVEGYDPLFHNSHTLNTDLNPDPNPGQEFDPDIIGCFDYIRFDEVTLPAELQGVDLVNSASDPQLLSFLGYESEIFCPNSFTISDTLGTEQFVFVQGDSLNLQSSILGTSHIELSATTQLVLLPGTEIHTGSLLNASLEGCKL